MSNALLNENQRDCLQEIGNVALGHAADMLARERHVFVNLSIPSVKLLNAESLAETLEAYPLNDLICCASQRFRLGGDMGIAALILTEQAIQSLVDECKEPMQLLAGTSDTLMQASLGAFAEHWQCDVETTQIALSWQQPFQQICCALAEEHRQLLMVAMSLRVEGRPFRAELLLLFPDETIQAALARVDYLLNY